MAPPRSSANLETGASPLTRARFTELVDKAEQYRLGGDLGLLRRAYEFSAREHGAQTRASGEPFLSHPLEVAHLLAEMRLDVTTLAVALLHDVVEDTHVRQETLEELFGREVAHLVEGLTKIDRLDFSSQETEQAENLRKMLLAMVDDVRVVLVKLADRLHNMRTLSYLPSDKRQRVARETLEIYAPIAHRLGMGRMRSELEDLAFSCLEPDAAAHIRRQLEDKRRLNESFLADVQKVIAEAMTSNGIGAQVEGRIKRPYSIHQKMVRNGVALDQIYDLLAVRVITESVRDCYAALGVLHQLWRPVPGRFKDYIAMPRPNLYQALHTSVIHSSGHPFEVQFRTQEMHRLAEQGIAAHWRYKEGDAVTPEDQQRIAWLRQLIEWAREMQDPSEFLSTLKVDLYPEEVYTFTPKGRVVVLPRQATPVDFAYAIHTEIGHTCVGAKVNGRIVPLRSHLQNGDIVEILTQPAHTPSRDWLSLVRTSRARNKIQHWIRSHQRQQAVELGRRLLEKEARRLGLSLKKVAEEQWQAAAREHGCQKPDELIARVGFGKYAPRQVLARLSSEPLPEERRAPRRERPLARVGAGLRRTVRRMFRLEDKGLPLHDRDLMMYRARCCNPIRGEEVIGYITRGRGIAVHAKACPNVQNLLYDLERRIKVTWAEDEGQPEAYPVHLAIRTNDRPGLLTQISGVIANHKCNIRAAEARSALADGTALIELTFDVESMKQLDRILAALKKVAGVRDVTRLLRAHSA
ncbi:MAG: GTP pyrophosphokinase [Acidobacteria bacterium RIFCSPHIGHO2_12_FULL_67_30]|nr:MAG: GTP pyrophosphokinase [Acidobacteria bacterium RIFCSPHIGHO2_02_FULL_67_57]OFV85792.1 MAG: GTP pyrophosphokinase [Acidobacteria bacterium RIFCSPHIGHO2_01_FULL_67_28]OFV89494.1 MAG: GTP pyrophosphokinase [Acidobacteria bacterium RIFCSPHIGHO2_12_FULL_67_30]